MGEGKKKKLDDKQSKSDMQGGRLKEKRSDTRPWVC